MRLYIHADLKILFIINNYIMVNFTYYQTVPLSTAENLNFYITINYLENNKYLSILTH
jgi:hypothetical protein